MSFFLSLYLKVKFTVKTFYITWQKFNLNVFIKLKPDLKVLFNQETERDTILYYTTILDAMLITPYVKKQKKRTNYEPNNIQIKKYKTYLSNLQKNITNIHTN